MAIGARFELIDSNLWFFETQRPVYVTAEDEDAQR